MKKKCLICDKSKIDSINLGDILEHVKAPGEFLDECLRVLSPGGILLISTPNTNSLFPKITRFFYDKFGIMWSHPTPPYHLFDFSDKNLEIFLKGRNVEILDIQYSRIPFMYSIYHTGYFDEIRKKMEGHSKGQVLKGIWSSIGFGIFRQIAVTFIYGFAFAVAKMGRKGDHMILIGRKNGAS
jgi:SAM-dependent methyltransferase